MFKSKSSLEFIVLHSLSRGNKNGYSLMKEIEQKTGTKPSPGSLYPLLTKLCKQKCLTVKQQGNKKIYSLTATGKKTFKKLQKHKEDYAESMKKHAKVLEHITGHKQNDMVKIFDNLKKGKVPFLWMLPDALKLRKTLLATAERVKDSKKRTKARLILRKAVKELQKL